MQFGIVRDLFVLNLLKKKEKRKISSFKYCEKRIHVNKTTRSNFPPTRRVLSAGVPGVDVWTHHRDDVGDAVTAVNDGARQRALPNLSGRPGGGQGQNSLQTQQVAPRSSTCSVWVQLQGHQNLQVLGGVGHLSGI